MIFATRPASGRTMAAGPKYNDPPRHKPEGIKRTACEHVNGGCAQGPGKKRPCPRAGWGA